MDEPTSNDSLPITPPTTWEFPRDEFLGLLRAGLWPADALAYLRVSRAQWKSARERDPALSDDTRRAVAAFQLIHIRNLHERILKTNDWRGSAWWLAQRFPRRYGAGRESKEAEKAVQSVITAIDDSLRAEFNTPADLERVGKALSRLSRQ